MASRGEGHIPVLIEPVLELLAPKAGEVYVDGTAGLGGHASRFAHSVGEGGTVVLCDLDASNLAQAAARVRSESDCRVVTHHGSFTDLPRVMEDAGLQADMVLADLGFASNQVDDPSRGLSFREKGPLDMRLDTSRGVPAAAFVNSMSEEELADLIFQYGEERASRRIARAIVERRKERPFQITTDLADVVRASAGPAPKGRKRIDRATRTFQALRIAVNGELEAVDALLSHVRSAAARVGRGEEAWLSPGARVGIIAFHSLEDRPVKRAFQEIEQAGDGRRLTRKPVVADEAESALNPRSRSAKFRVLQLLDQKRPDAR